MKKLLVAALLAAGWAGTATAQTLYDDFEPAPGGTRLVTYARQAGTLNQAAANPGADAVNGSATCASYVRNSGQQYDNFDIETPRLMADVTPYVGSGGSTAGISKQISMAFYSAAPGTEVQLVLQNKAKSRATNSYPEGKLLGEFRATTTATNAWETLTFTFSYSGPGNFDPTVTVTTVDEITMFVAPATFSGLTTYFDNVRGPELVLPTAATALYEDFEGRRRLNYLAVNGTLTPGFANPAVGAANPSAVVGRYERDGANSFATLVLAPANATFLDDVTAYASPAATQQFSLRFYSPAAGVPVQVVLGNAAKIVAGGFSYPTGTHSLYLATTTVANAWETLTFSYQSGTYDPLVRPTEINRISLQIAPGQNDSGTYYYDDFGGVAATLPMARLYENFDDTRVLTYGNREGVLTESTPNPSLTGLNPNPLVGRYVRSSNQFDTFYARLPAPMDDVTDFKNNARHFSMRVYSPEPVGTPVSITFTDDTAPVSAYPTGRHSLYEARTTVQNDWQVLTFSYVFSPSEMNSVRSLTGFAVQFAGNTNSTGTWYFDQVYGPNFTEAAGTLYDDLENPGQLTYTTFAGGTLTEGSPNPAMFGANYSPTVARYVRGASPFSGIELTPVDGRRLADVTAYASQSATRFFYLKLFSRTPGTPVGLTIRNAAKAATSYPNGIHSEYSATTTKSNEWELLRFAYQTTGAGAFDPTVSASQVDQLVLLFNPGATDADGQEYDFDFVVGQDLLTPPPLPVELVAFTATKQGGAVQLDWRTASERNAAYFAVERSRDGRKFAPLDTLAAQGNSSSPRAYQFTDQRLPTGHRELYYRLRQVDSDGTATYSPVRAVQLDQMRQLALFPNPAHGGLSILGADAPIEVYDATGRHVVTVAAETDGPTRLTLPAGLATGLYVVRSGSQMQRLTVE